MGCTYSSLSFSNMLELLQASGVKVVSTQQVNACKQIHTLHLLYKIQHFQLTYLNGDLHLCHRTKGRAKFLTIHSMISAMDRVANEKPLTDRAEDLYSVYADIWKDEVPENCEIRLNFGEIPPNYREGVLKGIREVLAAKGYALGNMTRHNQTIVVLPTNKLPEIRLTFLQLPSNPIYEWRNYM